MSLALVAAPSFARDPDVAPTVAASPARPDADRARMNQRVFDKVWNEVRTQYYDPHLHGVDWNAARRTWRPQALAATDDRVLYRVLDQMLNLLDDDHAGASPPAVTRRIDTLRERRPAMGVVLRRDETNPDVYLVETVRAGSPADEAGVAEGWKLQTGAPGAWFPEMDVVAGQTVTLSFLDETGAAHQTVVTPRMLDPQPLSWPTGPGRA